MPVVRRRNPRSTRPFTTGPWTSVVSTDDPFDYGDDDLTDAYNHFIPDPTNGSGIYGRPGFSLLNSGDPVTTSGSTFRGQGEFSFTSLDGVTSNFAVFNGKLCRGDAPLGVFTDVTPAGITIDPGITTRVFGSTVVTQFVVTDGVNRPWILTNPTATPVTGTYIDFDGMGTDWNTFGPYVEYAGSGVVILKSVNGVSARSDLVWTAPANVAVGYQQTDFDFRWTLGQSADGSTPPPLTGLAADNDALYYWREGSIGALSGIPGPNFQGSATHDAISKNVGTLAPQCIKQYGTIKYFIDAIGRPYRLVPGNDPEPIWKQMRSIVSKTSAAAFPAVTATVATATIEPNLNGGLYIVAPWSCNVGQIGPSTQGYIFDCVTGNYFGRFNVKSGVQLDTLGTFIDQSGRGVMVALGSLDLPTDSALAASGYVWGMNALVATGELLTTEDPAPGLVYLTTEDGVYLTTEGSAQSGWTDDGEVPQLSISTPRLGYAIDQMVTVDRAEALIPSGVAAQISAQTSNLATTVQGIGTASTTQDAIGRVVVGCDGVQGRGCVVTVTATTADEQFFVEQVSILASIATAPPEDG